MDTFLSKLKRKVYKLEIKNTKISGTCSLKMDKLKNKNFDDIEEASFWTGFLVTFSVNFINNA